MENVHSKPPNTIIGYNNAFEQSKFNERKRFSTWREKGHFYFDKIWRDLKLFTREDTYKWLASMLEVEEEKVHFSRMNAEQCDEAINYCQQLLNDMRRCDLDFGCEPKTPHYIINSTPFKPNTMIKKLRKHMNNQIKVIRECAGATNEEIITFLKAENYPKVLIDEAVGRL